MIEFEVFARTEVGCERERNEDAFVVLDLHTRESALLPDRRRRTLGPPGTLVAVCDGMGGAAAGDVASRMVIDVLRRISLPEAELHDPRAWEQALLSTIAEANREILDHAAAHPEKRGMGTTVTAATLFGAEIVLIHVGDSRAYLARGSTLTQLTVDQSVVGQMVAAGQLEPEEARASGHRNVLLEAVGVAPRFGPDLVRVSVQVGDTLLLCSDGLTGPLRDDTIAAILRRYPDPVPCTRALTEAACAAGGPDNVTVAVVRFVGAQQASPDRPVYLHRRSVLLET